MSFSLAHVGDRINPIVVKEVRQAVNSRIVAGSLLVFLLVQIIVMTILIGFKDIGSGTGSVDLTAGREMFGIVQGILAGTCILIIPALTGVRMASERSDVNVDLMFITSLSPWKIISGKFFAAAALALLIFSACAPFMTFAYVLRGLDIPTILLVLFIDYLAVLLGSIMTIFLASIPASRGFRIVLGILGMISLGYLVAGAVGASLSLIEIDYETFLGGREAWTSLVGGTVVVIGTIGLLFVWSIALVSPASANRALIVRLYTLGYWVILGAGSLAISVYFKDSGMILAWSLIGVFLFSLQLLIGVSEREEWGPRVVRRIPRRILFRIPAFFFFSGAAGGICFALIGGVISIAAIGILHACFLDWRWPSEWKEIPLVAALSFGYAYCYCLSAVLLRRFGKGWGLQPIHTWLLAGILFGLGSTLPYLFVEIFEERHARYYRNSDFQLIFLPSPVMTIEDAVDSRNSHEYLTWMFLVIWGLALALFNASWFAKQIKLFRPPRHPVDKEAAIEAELS